ncbi:Zn-dependent exopeptidase [Atractiella rhizophila]|nr:Zn-dependent exopeptidase [Atractiella rhizophila]
MLSLLLPLLTPSLASPTPPTQLPLSLSGTSHATLHALGHSPASILSSPDLLHSLASDPAIDVVDLHDFLFPEQAHLLQESRRLRVLGAPLDEVWDATEGEKWRLNRAGVKVADVTGFEGLKFNGASAGDEGPELPPIKHAYQVRGTIATLKKDNLNSTLTTLTSFHNRYFNAETGKQSALWIYHHVLDIASRAPYGTPLSIQLFNHPFRQPSVIARFEAPKTLPSTQDTVVIGAHQDSMNYLFPLLPAPGADDDGSGTVSILEAFRALAEGGFTPEKPVEFHWYAAEEGGLLGSREIVKSFVEANRSIAGMLQFDMTAYVGANKDYTPAVTLITSDATKGLTEWTMELARRYCALDVQGAILPPGAGSDHMSWYAAGYPAAFASEGDPNVEDAFDPYVHTVDDRMDLPGKVFSFDHALEFSKLAVAFAIELGGWTPWR